MPLSMADIDVENDPYGFSYIDGPTKRYRRTLNWFASYLKVLKDEEEISVRRKTAYISKLRRKL